MSKKQWNGMVVLVILIIVILAAPYVYSAFRKEPTVATRKFGEALALLEKAKKPAAATSSTSPTFAKKVAPGVVIELNTADSAALTGLNGIGPSFAKRIIIYRNRLGGFCKKEQLQEVFGLDADKYAALQAQVSVDASHIKKIAINSITFDDLSRFPYLSYKQANAVIRFREQHGEYESFDDLKNIAIMDEATIQKLKPYIRFK